MSYADKKQQVDLLQQKILAHGILSDEVKRKINYKYRLEWNYYSNSMEGNTLTKEETRSVMVGNLTVGGKPIKDVFEMKGHDEVIAEILKIGKGELRLSEKRIREIHSGIMHEENELQKNKIGRWKTEPNYVINYKGERFEFTLPAAVAEQMHSLLNKTNAAIDALEQKRKDAPHPIDIALQFHLDFVVIHPFYDGNGRTARILTNLLLISFGFPPFWVKTAERDIYNQYIADIQGYGGKPDLFFEFAAGLIIRSQQLVLDAIEGREIEEEDDVWKELQLIKKKKSNGGVLTKSPLLIYKAFLDFEKTALPILKSSLKNFDDLFSESTINTLFNRMDDLKKREPFIPNILERIVEPTTLKIFGRDIYQVEVSLLEWNFKMFGLIDGKKQTDFEIHCMLEFQKDKYSWDLKIGYKRISEISKDYGEYFNLEEINTIRDRLSRSLLNEIKISLGENQD